MFKIGEKIKIVKKDRWHASPDMDVLIGREFHVTHIDEDGHVSIDGEGAEYFFTGEGFISMEKEEIKMHKFNVGDRVKVMVARLAGQYGGYAPHMKMCEGSIYTIASLQPDLYGGRLGYRFKEDAAFTWDERCLRRVRKAKAVPVAKAPDAPVPVPVEAAPKEIRVEFQVGDVVTCIEPAGTFILNGQYVIAGIDKQYLEIVGKVGGGSAHRFKHSRVYFKDEPAPVIKEEVKPKAPAKAIIPTIGQELRKQVGGVAGTCSYAGEYDDGERWFQLQDACHARIPRYNSQQKINKLVLDIAGHIPKLGEDKKEGYLAYVNYVLTSSPWSPMFHNKGIDHALKNSVGIDVDKPLSRILGAAVALREGSEFSAKLEWFTKLLKAGHSGNTAYLLSCCLVRQVRSIGYQGFPNAHRVLDGRLDADKLIEFFHTGYAATDEKPYRDHHRKTTPIAVNIAPLAEQGAVSIDAYFKKLLKIKDAGGWDDERVVTEENVMAAALVLDDVLNKGY